MQTQNRDVVIGDYRFSESRHLHELKKDGEYKPLTGVTTVLKVISKGDVLVQWSANKAVEYIEEHSVGSYFEDEFHYLITKDNLLKAKTAWKDNRDSAGKAGTEIHSFIEGWINTAIAENNGYILQMETANKSVNKFINWAIENKVKFLASEKHVYSKEMWVGGICDFICEIDGKRYIGDIKTSKDIYPEHHIQCSAYAKMLEEMGEYKAEMITTKVIKGLPAEWRGVNISKPAFDGVVIVNLPKTGGFKVEYNYALDDNFECFKACLTIYRVLNSITK